ncbi:MAG: hypothetical protein HQ562_01930 [Candidatus Marinimicrobia bacterium]|nr:hypothetical protein [Candidatus Neomarinimicrobiota bacterium]
MKSTPTVQSLIKTHLNTGKIEYLEPVLELGVEKSVNPALLRKGFEVVGDHYTSNNSPVQAMLAFEKARVLVPYHVETVKKLFQSVDEFWLDAQEKASEDDLTQLGEYISEVVEFYQTHGGIRFYQPALQIGQRILNRIEELLKDAPIKIETPVSYSINQIISVKYDYLTPEQRKKEYGRIIGKSIRKILDKKKKMKKHV